MLRRRGGDKSKPAESELNSSVQSNGLQDASQKRRQEEKEKGEDQRFAGSKSESLADFRLRQRQAVGSAAAGPPASASPEAEDGAGARATGSPGRRGKRVPSQPADVTRREVGSYVSMLGTEVDGEEPRPGGVVGEEAEVLSRIQESRASRLQRIGRLAHDCAAVSVALGPGRRTSVAGMTVLHDVLLRAKHEHPRLCSVLEGMPPETSSAALGTLQAALEDAAALLPRVGSAFFFPSLRYKRRVREVARCVGTSLEEAFSDVAACLAVSHRALERRHHALQSAGDEAVAASAEEEAASADRAEAMVVEADRFMFGFGAPQSVDKALPLYTSAARLGSARAMAALGTLYRDGRGVPADMERAVRWLRAAAQRDNDEGRTLLADLYERGMVPDSASSRLAARLASDAADEEAEAAEAVEAGGSRPGGYGAGVRGGGAYPVDARDRRRGGSAGRRSPQIIQARTPRARTPGRQHAGSSVGEARPASARGAGVREWVVVEGRPVAAEDLETARGLYGQAARSGHGGAQTRLGRLLERDGVGYAGDPVAAARWYRMAAKQGIPEAQNNLGALLFAGRGEPRNLAEAAELFRRAAVQGSPGACFNLGACFESGRGVAKDPGQALTWYRRAAQAGHAQAQCSAGYLLLREGMALAGPALRPYDGAAAGRRAPAVAGDPTGGDPALRAAREEAAALLKEAESLLRHASDAGVVEASFHLAALTERGALGRARDAAAALAYYREAADADPPHAGAAERCATMYYDGRGAERDTVLALRYYRVAAEGGRGTAMNALGIMLEEGEGAPADLGGALHWFLCGGRAGNAAAMVNLAAMYIDGRGTAAQPEEGLAWLDRAEAAGAQREAVDPVRARAHALLERERRAGRKGAWQAGLSTPGTEAGRRAETQAEAEVGRRRAADAEAEARALGAARAAARRVEVQMAREHLGLAKPRRRRRAKAAQEHSPAEAQDEPSAVVAPAGGAEEEKEEPAVAAPQASGPSNAGTGAGVDEPTAAADEGGNIGSPDVEQDSDPGVLPAVAAAASAEGAEGASGPAGEDSSPAVEPGNAEAGNGETSTSSESAGV